MPSLPNAIVRTPCTTSTESDSPSTRNRDVLLVLERHGVSNIEECLASLLTDDCFKALSRLHSERATFDKARLQETKCSSDKNVKSVKLQPVFDAVVPLHDEDDFDTLVVPKMRAECSVAVKSDQQEILKYVIMPSEVPSTLTESHDLSWRFCGKSLSNLAAKQWFGNLILVIALFCVSSDIVSQFTTETCVEINPGVYSEPQPP